MKENFEKIRPIKLSRELIPLGGWEEEMADLQQIEMDAQRSSTPVMDEESWSAAAKGFLYEGKRHERFWNLLVNTVERSGYKPPVNKKTRILDVACGACREGMTVDRFFGGEEMHRKSARTDFIGIDSDPKLIESAIYNHSDYDFSNNKIERKPSTHFRFIKGDATKMDQNSEIPDQVDVAVIRHQQLVGEHLEDTARTKETWKQIFQQSLNKLAKDGIIIVTCYMDIERDEVVELLEGLGADIKINEFNKYASPFDDEGLYDFFEEDNKEPALDRYVIIAKKK